MRYFKNGRCTDGPFTLFEPDGSVKEGEWKGNLRIGVTTIYNRDFKITNEIVNPRKPTKQKVISKIYKQPKKREDDQKLTGLE